MPAVLPVYPSGRALLHDALGPQLLAINDIADAIEQMITDRLGGFTGGSVPSNALTWGGQTLDWGGQPLTWGP